MIFDVGGGLFLIVEKNKGGWTVEEQLDDKIDK